MEIDKNIYSDKLIIAKDESPTSHYLIKGRFHVHLRWNEVLLIWMITDEDPYEKVLHTLFMGHLNTSDDLKKVLELTLNIK